MTIEIHIKSEADGMLTIGGVASSATVDSYGEVVEPSGMSAHLPVPLNFEHDEFQTVGHVTKVEVKGDQVEFEATIKTLGLRGIRKRLVDRVVKMIKQNTGDIKGVSIGFSNLKSDVEKRGNVNVIKNWELVHLALTGAPSNPDAIIRYVRSSRDSATKGYIMDLKEQLKALQEERDEVIKSMQEIGNPSEFTAEQNAEFDKHTKSLNDLDAKIKRIQIMVEATGEAKPVKIEDQTQSGVKHYTQSRVRIDSAQEEKPAPGIMFARAVKAQLLASARHISVADAVRELYGSDDIGRRVRAAVEAGSTVAGNWGSPLYQPNAAAVEFLEYLAKETAFDKLGLPRVALGVPLVSQTGVGAAYFVGEGAAKPATKQAFAVQQLTGTKLAAIVGATDELLARSNVIGGEQIILQSLTRAIVEKLDTVFLDHNAAVAGVRPAGLLNGVTEVASVGNSADDIRADIKGRLQAFKAAGYPLSGVKIIMSSTDAIGVASLFNALGVQEFPQMTPTGGSILGIPVVVSDYVEPSSNGDTVLFVHVPNVYAYDNGVVTATSNSATVVLDDAGDGNPTYSAFQNDATILRAVRYIDWTKRVNAVQALKGVSWGA